MAKDAEMKDAEPAKAAEPEKPKTPAEQLAGCVELVEKAVSTKEPRFAARALRTTMALRKDLADAGVVAAFVEAALPVGAYGRSELLASVSGGMDTEGGEGGAGGAAPLPEVEALTRLVVTLHLVDKKAYDDAKAVSAASVERLGTFNRRSLDVIAARLYSYYSLANEYAGTLAEIRPALLRLYRVATLRHDAVGQETLLNLLLRNYLHYNLYDQAEKLRSKAQRPENPTNQQQCRYLYYLGRVRAVQLEYTDAKDCLSQAMRKAPRAAKGFKLTTVKWLALVRLLLGEIPERSLFRQPGMRAALQPYFELTNAVRLGDLPAFQATTEQYGAVFTADKTLNLITRLRRNVIRTGLRRINLAYQSISLTDIAQRLGLASVEDTEYIVAKAIRDGGMDAEIDHERGVVTSKDVTDIYSTQEPQAAFHARISFCLDTHNEAVRAMCYPPDAHKTALETPEARRERLQQEQELRLIAEEDDDEY